MKKIAILYKNYTPIIDAIKYYLSDYEIGCFTTPQNLNSFDLVINLGTEYDGEALACNHSLLPSFNCEEPVKAAILSGVKVTGITIYNTKTKKILAQYPVFINNYTHYDDLKQELIYIEQTLFPLIIKKILKNEPFETNELINHSCNGNCGGCTSCKH